MKPVVTLVIFFRRTHTHTHLFRRGVSGGKRYIVVALVGGSPVPGLSLRVYNHLLVQPPHGGREKKKRKSYFHISVSEDYPLVHKYVLFIYFPGSGNSVVTKATGRRIRRRRRRVVFVVCRASPPPLQAHL